MDGQKLVFVSTVGALDAPIKGGVQLCTQEFIDGLRFAGFEMAHFPARLSNRLSDRLIKRAGLSVYRDFNIKENMRRLVPFIERIKTKYVVLNQAMLSIFAEPLKRCFGDDVRVILISHGNESGDMLHDFSRMKKNPALFLALKQKIVLGSLLGHEAYFRRHLDHVFCLSETELQIENWLGAKSVSYIPRKVKPNFIKWEPKLATVGFVGTLDHPPNAIGLDLLLSHLHKAVQDTIRVRIVGGPRHIFDRCFRKYPMAEYVGQLNDRDLIDEVSGWSLLVHPIFWYSRGASLKVGKALEWGIPIVTTRPGMRGYDIEEKSLALATDPKHMAQLVTEYASSNDKPKELASRVRKAALDSKWESYKSKFYQGIVGYGNR
jgi:hypothetical protein